MVLLPLCRCQLSLSWHYLLIGYQLIFPFLASYCRFIRQPRPPNAAPHQGSIKVRTKGEQGVYEPKLCV